MTKKELIAALRASKTPDTETVFIWDAGNCGRYRLEAVDDSCGVLDLNCNKQDDENWEDK